MVCVHGGCGFTVRVSLPSLVCVWLNFRLCGWGWVVTGSGRPPSIFPGVRTFPHVFDTNTWQTKNVCPGVWPCQSTGTKNLCACATSRNRFFVTTLRRLQLPCSRRASVAHCSGTVAAWDADQGLGLYSHHILTIPQVTRKCKTRHVSKQQLMLYSIRSNHYIDVQFHNAAAWRSRRAFCFRQCVWQNGTKCWKVGDDSARQQSAPQCFWLLVTFSTLQDQCRTAKWFMNLNVYTVFLCFLCSVF